MGDQQHKIQLRTINDITEAHEWLLNKQRAGTIDSKAADAMNTTLKGSMYLQGKLRIDYFRLMLQAEVKKVKIPFDLLQIAGSGETPQQAEETS